jgi:hypothetical protein
LTKEELIATSIMGLCPRLFWVADQSGLRRVAAIEISCSSVAGLVSIANEMNQNPQGLEIGHVARPALKNINRVVDRVNDVVWRSRGSGVGILRESHRQVDVMPLVVLWELRVELLGLRSSFRRPECRFPANRTSSSQPAIAARSSLPRSFTIFAFASGVSNTAARSFWRGFVVDGSPW